MMDTFIIHDDTMYTMTSESFADRYCEAKKIYKPVTTYAAKTVYLTNNNKNSLRPLQKKLVKKITSPITKSDRETTGGKQFICYANNWKKRQNLLSYKDGVSLHDTN